MPLDASLPPVAEDERILLVFGSLNGGRTRGVAIPNYYRDQNQNLFLRPSRAPFRVVAGGETRRAFDFTVISRIKKRVNPYAQIDKQALEDDRLSWKAKGILCYLLSKPDDWVVRREDIVKHASDGREAVQNAMKELAEFGYATLEILQGEDGGMEGKAWVVYETPQETADERETRLSADERVYPTNGKPVRRETRSYSNNDLTKNESNSKKEARPTLEESKSYGLEIGLLEREVHKFFDHFSSNGWRVGGRAPMKDWRSAMRGWKSRFEEGAFRNGNGCKTQEEKRKGEYPMHKMKPVIRISDKDDEDEEIPFQ